MDLNTAGPLVLQELSKACSQNADVLKPAEHQLKQWETQSGFYSILLVSISAVTVIYPQDLFPLGMDNNHVSDFLKMIYICEMIKDIYFLDTISLRPCRVGSVGSLSASRTVGREFASRPGHTKDHHKNDTNCLPA